MMWLNRLLTFAPAVTAVVIDYNPYDNPETKLQAFSENEDGSNDEDLLIAMYPKMISLKGHPFLKGVKQFHDEVCCESCPKRTRGLRVAMCLGKGVCTNELDRWHVDGDDLPVAMLFPGRREDHPKGRYRWDLKDAPDVLGNLKEFVQRYDSGELKPYIKSQPAPTEQFGPVREVVGSTFQQDVLEKNVTTLMLLYYPWCGYSKMVKNFVREIGHRVGSENPMLQVAQMDTSSNGNEVPAWVHVDRSHAPRLYLFRPGNMRDPELLLDPVMHAEANRSDEALASLEAILPGLGLTKRAEDRAADNASGSPEISDL